MKGEGRVGGNLNRLTVEHDLSGSAGVRLAAVVEAVLDAPSWDGKIEILNLDLPAFQADLPAADVTGLLQTRGDLKDARVTGNLTGEAPDLPDFGRLRVDLDLTWGGQVLEIAALELTEDKSGAHLTAGGQVDLNPPDGRFELAAAWEKLRWPLTGELLAEARQGKVDAEGSFEAFEYKASAEVWGRDFPQALLNLEGEGDARGTRIGALVVDVLEGKVEARGSLAWAPALGWDLTLSARDIDPGAQWPEVPAKIGLELTSAGGLESFDYDLDGELESVTVPSAKLALQGSGDQRGTRITSLRLDTLGGHVEGEAEMGWDPLVSWEAELTAEGIDPGKQWAEWSGVVGGRVASSGILEDEGPDLNAVIEGLKGTLRGYPVEAEARVQMQGGEILVERVNIASGPTRLQAQGSAGERLDLTFDLNSPDLKSLLPEAAGSVKASGNVSGARETPAVKLDLAAEGVSVAGQGLRRLTGKADLDLAAGGAIKLDLSGEGLTAGGMAFDSLRIEGDGDMGSHRLSARVQGEPLSVQLAAEGGLAEGNAYAGQVTGLEVRSPDYGNWRLEKAAALRYAGEQVSAGPVCLRDGGGSGGCVSFEQQAAGRWKSEFDLDKLAFDLLAAFIPQDLTLEGEANAKGSFEASAGTISGNARLAIPRGLLSAQGRERPEVIDFSATQLSVEVKGDGLRAGLDLPLAGLGGAEAEVSLPGWRMDDPARSDQALRGRVRANIDDLGLVARFVPDVTDLRGNIEADLGLAGTIGAPGLSGFARLANGGLAVPLIGLKVEDLSFQADAQGGNLFVYSGGFTAGDGRLEISGQTQLGAQGAATQIRAAGQRLTIANSKEYFALVSPDIAVEITPEGTVVSGEVVVPEARIRPRTIPEGTVTPSPDVMLASEARKEDEGRYSTSIDVRLVLGDQVSIKAFGLEGELVGDLRVLKDPGKDDILGDGQLAIVEGSYRISSGVGLTAAIGKPLTIEQGFLNWARSDIANPFLVLTAQREGGDVTAGLRVFGTIRNPKMTFFSASDPGMSQSEVSNYLLTGIPPRGKEDNENKALSVGTYVAPKLFVEYDYSLGDEADKIKLRYDLNSWIELQTETGDAQGGDVFFKFER